MKLSSKGVARHAVVLLLVPAFLVAGCQKQNNNSQQARGQRATEQQAHENFEGGGRQRLRAVCADEIQKYCANADRKRRCLRENMDKLSDACKTAVTQRGGRRARDNNGGDQ